MNDQYRSTETAQVARLDERIKTMERDMREMSDKLDEVLKTLQEARGGWRTLMWLSGAASALGGAIVWLLSNFQLKP